MRYVKMLDTKQLVRQRLINIEHVSDDGEFMRFKILPNGPSIGMWMPDPNENILVVNCTTVHENMLKMCPQLYTNEDGSPLETQRKE